MNDPARVCVVERRRDRREDADRVVERQRRTKLIRERPTIDELRHQIRDVAVGREVERGDDVGVAQLADRARLLREPLGERRIAGRLRRKHLDRDVTAKRGLVALVHGAHTAGTDLLDDLVVAEAVARLERHASASTR